MRDNVTFYDVYFDILSSLIGNETIDTYKGSEFYNSAKELAEKAKKVWDKCNELGSRNSYQFNDWLAINEYFVTEYKVAKYGFTFIGIRQIDGLDKPTFVPITEQKDLENVIGYMYYLHFGE